MEKLIKDGRVAVLYSPGFGAGWSTWNSEYPEMVFDHEIAQALMEGNKPKAEEIAVEKYVDAYLGGFDQLQIEWVPIGTRFEIHEYDGSETVHIIGPDTGYVA